MNKKLKIGITGQSGFIGSHLYNFLSLKEEIHLVESKDEYFNDIEILRSFVSKCDVIVHLAAMNRHGNPQVIYDTNIRLVKQLIEACQKTNSTPHILFSSSTQENQDNLYGKSKLDGRILFEQWAKKSNTRFTRLVIPNVFGPFGHPYYNSVVATFCHQLTHNEKPQIQVDGQLKLIYVSELVEELFKAIQLKLPCQYEAVSQYIIPFTKEIKVSDILQLLENFKTDYFEKGIFPSLDDFFIKNLFNTFICYIDIEKYYPGKFKLHTDDRGSFVETMKLNSGGQVSFSTTKPGITRGNHFHTRKAERFAVIKGKARIQLRRIGTNKVINYFLDGKEPAYVDMPVWYTHNITNIGNDELLTIFWINEHFDSDDADTFFELV